MRNYTRSLELLTKAEAVTPGGAQTLSKRPQNFVKGAWPVFLKSGDGARVVDVDGNVYTDWICGLAALGLGYRHPYVDAVTVMQIQSSGVSFSLPTPLEAELAERLCDVIPCAESVRFTKTGSEATQAAVRIARAATGRDVVLTCGYHGWHDWYAATREQHPGVPEVITALARPFQYNNLTSLDDAIAVASDYWKYATAEGCEMPWGEHIVTPGVAAIILEPTLIAPPAPGFLEGVRERATRIGAVLIFDEMVCGFRWAVGGAQERFHVKPDLATFGKAMANGYPIACVVGNKNLMRHADVVSGTFGGEAVSLAAALATLDVYQREPVIAHLWEIGEALIEGFRRDVQGPFRIVGQPPHPKIEATTDDAETNRLLMSVFLQEAAARGVLIHPGGFNVSYAHTMQHAREAVTVFAEAAGVATRALEDGGLAETLRGEPYQTGFRVTR